MIAEVVGPAGAGKTTIAQAIAQRNPAIQLDPQIRFRQFLPAFYARAALSLPVYLLRYRNSGSQFWQGLMKMAYLEKLHSVIAQNTSNGYPILFMDQGPVFGLTYVRKFGFGAIRDRRLDKWWLRNLDHWSSMLDAIFWVDAPNSVLLERINRRDKWHRAQDWSDQEAEEFLVDYREAYRRVISKLISKGSPRLFRYSTDQGSANDVVDSILCVLGTGRAEW